MRVSKTDGSQMLDLQRDALLAAGVEPGHIYEDQASGKRDNRPGLEACLKALRQGDTLVAWKLDRLGRDLRHLVNLVHDLTGRGIGLKILAGQGAQLDTTTANGRLIFCIFAALAAAGAATIAVELSDGVDRGDLPAPTVLSIPVGNGALIDGIGSWARHALPATRVIGIQAEGAAAMTLSWRAGRPVDTDTVDTFADGIAARVSIPIAVELMAGRVDDM